MSSDKKIIRVAFLFFFIIISLPGMSQVTKIMGKVTDSISGEPIPFANVYFKGTTIGVTSDFDGGFSIESQTLTDTLIISCMGYKPQEIKIGKNRFQEINILLKPSNITLSEFVFNAGENPADTILRNIIKNKEKNNFTEFDYYQYEIYNKVEIDANNITDKFKERRFPKPFRFIFDYMDTSAVNGKTFLPVFLSETFSEYYFRKNPRAEKEIIKAVKTSGVKNQSLMQYMGEMFQKYNFYDNYIRVVSKNFVSPIANSGFGYYKYYLIDSALIGNKWCYKIMFKPKRKQELTFTGNMWVNDTTWAIKSFEIRLAKDANINFLNDAIFKKEYELVDNKYWVVTKDELFADVNLYENTKTILGFFGRKTTFYSNYIFNKPKDKKFYTQPVNVIIADNAHDHPDEFWEKNRPDTLSKNEKTIYYMVDTLTNLPVFKTWVDIAKAVFTGYYKINKVEIGPYMKLASFNPIEGVRLRIGGRTTKEFNEHIRLNAYVAYGLDDRQIKYGGGFLYILNKNPRRAISGNYKYDIEQLGTSPRALKEDLLISSLFRREPANKMSMTKEFTFSYEHEWYNGLINTFNYTYKEIIPIGEEQVVVFNNDGDEVSLKNITTSEFRLDTRISFQENFITGTFKRASLGSKYPVIGIQYGLAIPDMFNSSYGYQKLRIGIRHWFNVFNIGWSKYILEAGKVWGTIPWPLLRLHPGNETFLYDVYSYNLMNYFEFISDQYVSLSYSHHFDGLLFNRIPLIRKLKWREVVNFRGVIGSMTQKNTEFNKLPSISHTLEKPYMEAGVGIENIFKVIRVDAIWRLSHLENNNTNKFGVFMSFNFTF